MHTLSQLALADHTSHSPQAIPPQLGLCIRTHLWLALRAMLLVELRLMLQASRLSSQSRRSGSLLRRDRRPAPRHPTSMRTRPRTSSQRVINPTEAYRSHQLASASARWQADIRICVWPCRRCPPLLRLRVKQHPGTHHRLRTIRPISLRHSNTIEQCGTTTPLSAMRPPQVCQGQCRATTISSSSNRVSNPSRPSPPCRPKRALSLCMIMRIKATRPPPRNDQTAQRT
jgi:hypothetical protein